ncbi:MAG: type II secretion system F family protein [Patescibacteria group bacterium]|jgi:type IV pilus assembly protein PilC
MNTFEYTVIDLKNSIYRGHVRSWTKRQAAKQLTEHGVSIVTLSKVKNSMLGWRKIFRHISRIDRIVFFRNLMTMMRAGLNLTEALSSSREQATNPLMKKVIADAEKAVLAGQPFSVALSQHKNLFSPVIIAMVRIGERGGKLVETIEYLVKQQESDYALLRKIRNALVYPALIVFTMIAIVIVMMIVVIPKISQVYVDSGASLPFYTQALVDISHFILAYGLYIAIGLVALFLIFRSELRASISFRRAMHRLLLRLPIIGIIIKKLNLAMISRSLHMLTHGGYSIDEGMILASHVASNQAYQDALKAAEPFIRRGVKLTDVFKGSPKIFLPLFNKMVMTGEETGNLDVMFSHVAKYYDDDIQNWSSNLSTMIEPALLLVTGVVVGSVSLAIIYPLWNFANII